MMEVNFSSEQTPCTVLQDGRVVGHITKGRRWYCLYLNGLLFDDDGNASPSNSGVAHNGCYTPRRLREAMLKARHVCGTIKLRESRSRRARV